MSFGSFGLFSLEELRLEHLEAGVLDHDGQRDILLAQLASVIVQLLVLFESVLSVLASDLRDFAK